MAAILNFTESQTLAALRSFLLNILPAGVEVIQGQPNRVAEPSGPDFVVFTPILRERLETNTDTVADALFQGSIAGTVLTVDSVDFGVLAVGRTIFGLTVAQNSVISAQINTTGRAGTYRLTTPQDVALGPLACGFKAALQPTQITVQIDVHGPNAADNAQIITTLFRDEYAADSFAGSGIDVTPLYAGEPRQMPFPNAEQQIETRWTLDAVLQANQSLTIPQEFAGSLNINLLDVDAVYPPH